MFKYLNNSQTIDNNKVLFFAVLPNAVTGEMETPGTNPQPGGSGTNVTPAGPVTAGITTTPASTDKTVTQTDQDKEKESRKRRHSASSSRSTSSKSSRKSSKSDSRGSKSKSSKEDAKSTTSDSTQDKHNSTTNKPPDAFLEVQAEMLKMLRQLANKDEGSKGSSRVENTPSSTKRKAAQIEVSEVDDETDLGEWISEEEQDWTSAKQPTLLRNKQKAKENDSDSNSSVEDWLHNQPIAPSPPLKRRKITAEPGSKFKIKRASKSAGSNEYRMVGVPAIREVQVLAQIIFSLFT